MRSTNPADFATAYSGGLHTDTAVALANVTLDGNRVIVAGGLGAQGDSGAGELAGTLDHVRLSGNTVTVSASHGDVLAGPGAAILWWNTLTASTVDGNAVRARAARGSVYALGGGLGTFGVVTITGGSVSGNSVSASGLNGSAEGGGIWNSAVPDGPPLVALTLSHTSVTGNAVEGSVGVSLQGGGLFTTLPVTLVDAIVAGNSPDQCVGC